MTLREQANGVTLALVAAIALLAAMAVNLAHTIHSEPTRMPPGAVAAGVAPAGSPQGIANAARTDAPSGAPLTSWSTPARTQLASQYQPGQRDAGDIAVAKYRLSRLKDPQGRAERSRQLADDARRHLGGMLPAIELSPAEMDRVVATAADLALQAEQRRRECEADPGCDLQMLNDPMNAEVEQQVEQLLGPLMLSRLDIYPVEGLRARLADNSFSDDTARKLLKALTDERQRFAQAAQLAGETMEISNSGGTGIPVLSTARTGSSDVSAQRQASAALYTQRVITRAATVLSGDALEVFRSSQEAALESYRRGLREQEVMRNARLAADKSVPTGN